MPSQQLVSSRLPQKTLLDPLAWRQSLYAYHGTTSVQHHFVSPNQFLHDPYLILVIVGILVTVE